MIISIPKPPKVIIVLSGSWIALYGLSHLPSFPLLLPLSGLLGCLLGWILIAWSERRVEKIRRKVEKSEDQCRAATSAARDAMIAQGYIPTDIIAGDWKGAPDDNGVMHWEKIEQKDKMDLNEELNKLRDYMEGRDDGDL